MGCYFFKCGWRGWRANVGGMLLLLFMLLLKHYPEQKICEFLVLKKKKEKCLKRICTVI